MTTNAHTVWTPEAGWHNGPPTRLELDQTGRITTTNPRHPADTHDICPKHDRPELADNRIETDDRTGRSFDVTTYACGHTVELEIR